ncbi:MAG TPA: gamma-glutamyltransferase, partial [Candidatus Polarisedimenticolaceae bacterium]|nr:gamma-glutamyltransferase [Candidatus Polarisedimenticolaceae bacterium]
MRRSILSLAGLVVVTTGLHAASLPPARGSHGIAATPDAYATQAALDTLRAGGNAVDAAVAAAFTLAVTFPIAGNLGGGGFLLYRPPQGDAQALDFRETAPAALTAAAFLGPDGRP